VLGLALLIFWAAAALLFVALSGHPHLQTATTVGAYWLVAAFSARSLALAVRRSSGRERLLWSLLCGGLLLRLAGYFLWLGSRGAPAALGKFVPEPEHAAYVLSYLLLFGAMLVLVSNAVRGITLVAALDASAILLTSGMLVWRFVLGPTVGPEAGGALGALALLFRPAVDSGLLFLALVALSTPKRPPLAPLLAEAYFAFLLADGSYLGTRASGGTYELGGWAELLWALGILLLGIAALRPGLAPEGSAAPLGIGAARQAAFWTGPLSPLVHYAALLASGVLIPPVPDYVAAGGVALMAYAILRTSLAAGISERFRSEQAKRAKRSEQDRLSKELHDQVKQNVTGVHLLLRSAKAAKDSGDADIALHLAEKALEAARDAHYQIGKPIDELRMLLENGGAPPRPSSGSLLRLTGRLERDFGLKVHSRGSSLLDELDPEVQGPVLRVVNEALWNCARHARASNVWVEVDRAPAGGLGVRVRDDGSGFVEGEEGYGAGISLMRARAAQVGARLELASAPDKGTTVSFELGGRR
jgi:signal transduction histidine kinase